jgi:hypothetical protein
MICRIWKTNKMTTRILMIRKVIGTVSARHSTGLNSGPFSEHRTVLTANIKASQTHKNGTGSVCLHSHDRLTLINNK